MSYLLIQFTLAVFATFGFAIIFRVPVRHLPACVVTGGLGWIAYIITVHYFESPVMGCFIGACVVGLMSTLDSYLFKEANTIFIIPGILCLVPGSNIFYTMEALLLKDTGEATAIGLQTLLMAGAIAMGLLVVGSIFATSRSVKRRAGAFRDWIAEIKMKD